MSEDPLEKIAQGIEALKGGQEDLAAVVLQLKTNLATVFNEVQNLAKNQAASAVLMADLAGRVTILEHGSQAIPGTPALPSFGNASIVAFDAAIGKSLAPIAEQTEAVVTAVKATRTYHFAVLVIACVVALVEVARTLGGHG